MEINRGCSTTDEEYSLSEILSSLTSEDRNELNPLEEIFGVHSNSRQTCSDLKLENERDTTNHSNKNKRQRSMEYRVMMEKKRRQLIRNKVDILQEMTPNCPKSDIATKLENIIKYIKCLKHQIEMMSMAYRAPRGYMPPLYGAQAPCMSPWGYPMIPHQNMPFIPQFYEVDDRAPPNQMQP